MHVFLIIIIAISLSMDAFSLSLAYGTLNMPLKSRKQLSVIVGIYHFIMPLCGVLVGNTLLNIIPIGADILVCAVLCFIGVQMILESKEEKNVKLMNFQELLLFGLAVSLDSFSVGMGFSMITHHYFLGAFLFSIMSSFFTYLGLELGHKINMKVGSLSTMIGGIVLIVIGIMYLL